MVKTIIFSINVFLVALVVGSMFAVWYGFNPNKLSYNDYVVHQQQLINQLNVKLPVLALIAILLTIISAILARGDKKLMVLLIATAIFLIISGIVTRFLNQPINAKVMTWVADKPPSNWMELRADWWKWHIVRLISGIISFGCLIIGFLNRSG
ncbi:DUF1772 domain-containing protein [Lederbergia panacisoli]|uniref:DUF1772 domain-containing protein n=1 Tax=Lederbergia panacisoli TaxID=1255251 RepID=UPI00214B5912|nr:DUF1772 domain-containing protein [Lederbergia panacisoli]MCR2822709.1 DUF1772 domain-containing protein [Lederbergia panacisoli]